MEAVNLINDNDLRIRKSAPGRYGLDAANLYRPAPIRHGVIALDHADIGAAFRPERFDGLIDERYRRNHEGHPIALALGAIHDRCRDLGFSCSGRRLQDYAPDALSYRCPNIVQGGLGTDATL